jgi:NADH dehydrogenase
MPDVSKPSRVVIVGAGFGGLATTKALANAPVEITLVDRHNFHTFQPLLYQVATAGLNATDVAHAVRGIFHKQDNVEFRRATVTGVDWSAHTVELDHGAEPSLAFDHIVVAAGASASFFGIPGAAEHGLALYTLGDAVALRNHVLERFEAADADPALLDDGVLTFAIVGGGPTGVEVAGALSELFAMVLRKDFRALDVSRASVVLIEMADTLLTPFAPISQRSAAETLAGMGVELRLGEAVTSVTATRVALRSGEELKAHTLIWAAGVQANPLAQALGVETGRGGRIVVGPDLRIAGHPEAFAIGDVAGSRSATGDELLPQLAPVAIQGGHHVAKEIVASLEGRPSKRFRYRDKGIMATIGRRAAVAELPLGVKLRGTPAWLAWLGLHLVTLVGFRNRLSVFLNWAWNYVTWDRGPRIILRPEERRAP